MGIDVPALRFLLDSHSRIGPFGATLQIGHQGLHFYPETLDQADEIVRASGLAASLRSLTGDGPYGDELLQRLGATTVDAMDMSSYEGAGIIQDLSDPVPPHLHGRYRTVFDGGSLEHIFNTPMAVANLTNMLEIGGTLLLVTAANNFLGHGFYQFSPEWAYRTFGPERGFEMIGCYVVDCDEAYDLVPAEDPAALGRRVERLMTPVHTYLMVAATKRRIMRFDNWPQQSDYVAQWTDRSDPATVEGATPGRSHDRQPRFGPAFLLRRLLKRFGFGRRAEIGGFDRAFYLRTYPDVAAAGVDPLQHYLTVGWTEGRDPSAVFSTSAYLARNPDAAARGVNPLAHLWACGRARDDQA